MQRLLHYFITSTTNWITEHFMQDKTECPSTVFIVTIANVMYEKPLIIFWCDVTSPDNSESHVPLYCITDYCSITSEIVSCSLEI